MSDSVDRRTVLKGVAASAAAIGPDRRGAGARAGQPAVRGRRSPFPTISSRPRRANARTGPTSRRRGRCPRSCQRINYEEWGKIKYRDAFALFANGPGPFPITFFHLGLFFQKAVGMHVVEGGQSRKIIYEQAYFDMPANSPARELPAGAGIRRASRPGVAQRRARLAQERLGRLPRRRLFPLDRRIAPVRPVSARHRPRRRRGRPAGGISRLHPVLHRIRRSRRRHADALRPDGGALDRRRLSVPDDARQGRHHGHPGRRCSSGRRSRASASRPAPRCTGSPRPRRRPRSTGVPRCTIPTGSKCGRATASGCGAPLNNPPRIMVSSFLDDNPRGFGLMQRDRVFDHYLDGVYYDRRPSLWVEPLPGPDGQGLGQGVDPALRDPDRRRDPRQRRGHVGAGRARAGRARNCTSHYKLYWLADSPFPSGPRPGGGDAAWARRPARPAAAEGRAQVHGRVPRRPARNASLSASSRNWSSRPRAGCSAPIS